MKIRPTLLALVLLTLGASIAVAQPGSQSDQVERKYRVVETDRCPSDRPWAVVLVKSSEDEESVAEENGGEESTQSKREILECHVSEEAALQRVADLKASEADATEPGANGGSATAPLGEEGSRGEQPPAAEEPGPTEPPTEGPAPTEPPTEGPAPTEPPTEGPAPTEPPKPAPSPEAPDSSPATDSVTTTATATLSADAGDGLFILKCGSSHLAQVDPIVSPGTTSAHLHEFFGNRSTNDNSTYQSMVAAGTTCPSADTAGYWSPALVGPDGKVVRADGISAYYRNDPVRYAATVPFPRDFRMVAGGAGSPPAIAFWSCKNEGTRYTSAPKCDDGSFPRAIVHFPQCWDGVRLDSPDHRSHVAYPRKDVCPATHPVKLPHIKLYVRFPQSVGGSGYVFSDGMQVAHADFWNTWQQPALEELVVRCLNAGVDCGRQR